MSKIRSILPAIATAVIVIGFVNFFWFMSESFTQGGDALAGYVHAGHYYVGSHGTYTQVSQRVWNWSHLHGIIMFGTFPLIMICMAFLVLRVAMPRMIGLRDDEATHQQIQSVRQSGKAIATGACYGRVGAIQFSRIVVNVYPDGLVCQIIFLTPFAITNSQLIHTQPGMTYFGRQRGIEIDHRSPDILSPVFLDFAQDHPVVHALSMLVQTK